VVKRLERGDVIIDVGGNVEAKIAREDLIPAIIPYRRARAAI